jgi:hypothetical protein
VEPLNAYAHNMKLIDHDLKDKWILELLDGTTCLVPSISVYLGKKEKVMAT